MIGVERTLCGSWSACSVALGLGEQMHTSSSACDPPALGRPGLGGELCASQEGCVQGTAPRRGKTKCPQRQEDEPTGRRGSGIFCVLWQEVSSCPFRAPSFALVHFPGGESHFHGCCRHRTGAGHPTSEEAAWPGSGSLGAQQLSKFGLHAPSLHTTSPTEVPQICQFQTHNAAKKVSF